MKLELQTVRVRDVALGSPAGCAGGVLRVDAERLRAAALAEGDFADVSVEIVRPGEHTRVIHIVDAVEPRWKAGAGGPFPGWSGPVQPVGEGVTRRLAGVAVVSVSEAVAGETTYWSEAVLDATGPAAEFSPLGSNLLVVLDFRPAARYLNADAPEAAVEDVMEGSLLARTYFRKVRRATLRAAAQLAESAAAAPTDAVDRFELPAVAGPLPRVACVVQATPAIYGDSTFRPLGTLFHPNALMDGAFVCGRRSTASTRELTYFYQNPSVVRSLYDRHGTEVDFAGVVLFPRVPSDMEAKERAAVHAFQMMQALRVDGVCASSYGGGNPWVEFMLFCQKCEQAGIRTALALPESVGAPDDPGFVHYVPEAVAVVSTGRAPQRLALPAMGRVIGGTRLFGEEGDASGELDVPLQYVLGCNTNIGAGRLAGKSY